MSHDAESWNDIGEMWAAVMNTSTPKNHVPDNYDHQITDEKQKEVKTK